MAFSIESRVPFLTPNFVEMVLSLPPTCWISEDGTRKAVLRDAMRGIVPDSILDRRDKIGFQTPERALLRDSAKEVEQILLSDAATRVRGIKLDHLRETALRIQRGEPTDGVPLWRWINLIKWAECFDVMFR